MSAVVVTPLAITDEARDRAWQFIWHRLADDGWPVVASDVEHDSLPWCKATAVADALSRASGRGDDVLVIHDADLVVDLSALRESVAAVERHDAAWSIPYEQVLRLDESSTTRITSGGSAEAAQLVRAPYTGMPGGGVVVLRRDVYAQCPLDRRFVGWGDEDQAWGWALGTLFGAPHRVWGVDVLHLWHPPAVSHEQRHNDRPDVHRLWRAYRAYRANPQRMRALVDDGR